MVKMPAGCGVVWKNAAAIIVPAFIHNIEINKQKEYNKNIKNS